MFDSSGGYMSDGRRKIRGRGQGTTMGRMAACITSQNKEASSDGQALDVLQQFHEQIVGF
jgi:hypothetical protein